MFNDRKAYKAVLLGGCSALALGLSIEQAPATVSSTVIEPGSLVVSTSTYDNTQGAIASLVVGTTLPDTASSTTTAVAGNDYVNTWNNEDGTKSPAVDGDASYGVTSEITLLDLDATSGSVLHTVQVPTSQVVTSFSSKSELGLHIAGTGTNHRVTFVGYGLAGVGALDVSNSDAVADQDPTNPVTFAFGTNYAFHRTIVTMNGNGVFRYTPTIDYGGNNGRSGLSASNGLFYTVGNANNGNAATFGATSGCTSTSQTTSTLNCTNPDVTETTGLEVVTPVNSKTASGPTASSAEADPTLQFTFGTKTDKAGKDDNFRGITIYQGHLYFTKGSGSNGTDSVYTVSGGLPTVSNAASQSISVVPGFPTDSAKATGGNFTPFAVFFADASTMYVTDEGSGNTTDTSTHAGLEKWSLVGGTWQLDYTLTSGLIGTTDNLTGSDGAWPTITTVGLRNLTGHKNGDGTITLWATTSTSSASGDNGADPNKVVKITDRILAKSLTDKGVSSEAFSVVAGPTYGTVYRGVAYAK